MYGLISKMAALTGKRDELISILTEAPPTCPVV
jgi:hypothetical protein